MASATSTTSPDPSGSQPASSAPSAAVTGTAVRDRVQGIINLIRPAVQADGGDIELVDVTSDGIVQIRFHGACHGCPSSSMTLHQGIERNLREKIPEVIRVIAVP